MKKPVDVEIMGQRFTVTSDAEESYVRKVARYVDGRIQEVLKSARGGGRSNAALLAALNIADEHHRLREKHEALLSRLDHLTKRLSISLTEEG